MKAYEEHILTECSASASFEINCDLCKMTFASKDAYKVHRSEKHFDGGVKGNRICPYCGHKNKTKRCMEMHIDSKVFYIITWPITSIYTLAHCVRIHLLVSLYSKAKLLSTQN